MSAESVPFVDAGGFIRFHVVEYADVRAVCARAGGAASSDQSESGREAGRGRAAARTPVPRTDGTPRVAGR